MIHNRYRHIAGLEEEFFSIDSNELDSDISFIHANKIENLILNARADYKLLNVNWLEKVSRFVKKLIITTPSKTFSLDGLAYCRSLRSLKVNNFSKSSIPIDKIRSLECLDTDDFTKVTGLESSHSLKKIIGGKLPKKYQTKDFWCSFQNLEFLCIFSSKIESGLGFLGKTNLNNLYLYSCSFVDFVGVNEINLESLKIEKCKKIAHENTVFDMQSLKSLILIDSFCIEKPEIILEMNSLIKLIILGKSHFLEGNISILDKKLEVFNFDDKRHYDRKFRRSKG